MVSPIITETSVWKSVSYIKAVSELNQKLTWLILSNLLPLFNRSKACLLTVLVLSRSQNFFCSSKLVLLLYFSCLYKLAELNFYNQLFFNLNQCNNLTRSPWPSPTKRYSTSPNSAFCPLTILPASRQTSSSFKRPQSRLFYMLNRITQTLKSVSWTHRK